MDGKKTKPIGDVRLLNEHIQPLRQLPQFLKHHRIPQSVGDGDRRFLAEIASTGLNDDLQEKFSELRSAFGFKRREISVNGPIDGGGLITTPFFNYEITISFLETEPGKVVWRRSIIDIRDSSQIFSQAFIQVFGNQFSILELETAGDLDLAAIVDHVEDSELLAVEIDYDKDVTWCEIHVANSIAAVKLSNNAIRVTSRHEVSPRELLRAFVEVQHQFLASLNCAGNPFLTEAV